MRQGPTAETLDRALCYVLLNQEISGKHRMFHFCCCFPDASSTVEQKKNKIKNSNNEYSPFGKRKVFKGLLTQSVAQ